MSILDNEQIIDDVFINGILDLQLTHIKRFLYNHSSHIIYKHCKGEDGYIVPKEFKYLPIRRSTKNGFIYEESNEYIKEKLGVFDLVLENDIYKLRGRGGGFLLIPDESVYIRLDNGCIKLHESIILDNCEFIKIMRYDTGKMICHKLIDGRGEEFNIEYA